MKRYILIICCFLSFSAVGQNLQVAENYMEQGEIKKAKAVYEKLYEQNPKDKRHALGLAQSQLELKDYENAQQTLQSYLKDRQQPDVMVVLGHVYTVQGEDQKADVWYKKAISKIEERPYFAFTIGKKFEEYGLLNQAIRTYEKGNALRPSINFKIKLARIYGEKGNLEKMFANYIDLITERENYYNVIRRNFDGYITENPDNEANQIFRKLLIKNIQKAPHIMLNKMLSWLYIQEKQYLKAFAQQKAIVMRTDSSYQSMIYIGEVAAEEGFTDQAKQIYKSIIKQAKTKGAKIEATTALMQLNVRQADQQDYASLEEDYENYLNQFGRGKDTENLQLDFARFLAFKLENIDKSKAMINALLDKNLYRFSEGNAKLLLADILVLEEKFNQALIYYTKVEKMLPNNPLGQKAKFKVARTSYYKGDFDWAVTQLDVLKKATSQLIANDALELALHIKDNGLRDSTQTALKKVAQADLMLFQNKKVSAEKQLSAVIAEFPNHDIIDEVHFRLAQIYQQQGKHQQALDAYKVIINNYPDSILIDNAYFQVAELLQYQLNNKQEAKDYYGKILFDHQDSIFYVEAQKEFRKLRGDQQIN
ncbi:MAG: tetratricopeptide repeat protein [Psychroflexus sp.]|nr:tetratricopeptide repeat protein [Psychroflexus sp.]